MSNSIASVNGEIRPIFDDIYITAKPLPKVNEQQFVLKKIIQQRLREILALDFSERYQIGLDSFKIQTSDINRFEMATVESSFQPKGANVRTIRGYGLRVKMNLE